MLTFLKFCIPTRRDTASSEELRRVKVMTSCPSVFVMVIPELNGKFLAIYIIRFAW
jgi:hypothetical protein